MLPRLDLSKNMQKIFYVIIHIGRTENVIKIENEIKSGIAVSVCALLV